jgi:hypothetical protein
MEAATPRYRALRIVGIVVLGLLVLSVLWFIFAATGNGSSDTGTGNKLQHTSP